MNGVLSTRVVRTSYKEDGWGNHVSSVREAVKRRAGGWREMAASLEALRQVGTEPSFRGRGYGSRGTAIVRKRYQATTSEITAG
jgi:GNAT superfamily N-acetyltransferase